MNVFLIIVIILVIVIAIGATYYFHGKYIAAKTAPSRWPPGPFMKTVGSKCPDYWTYQGQIDNNNHRCKNTFNIPVNAKGRMSPYCFDSPMGGAAPGSFKTFKTLKKWPAKKGELRERCAWIKSCGPTNNIPGSWIGVDKFC